MINEMFINDTRKLAQFAIDVQIVLASFVDFGGKFHAVFSYVAHVVNFKWANVNFIALFHVANIMQLH